MTERPSQKNGPRRPYVLRIFSHDGNADRGNTRSLDLALYQSNGLIADASPGGQEHDIDTGLFQS